MITGDLWEWIGEQSINLQRETEESKDIDSEGYKLLLMGRREMLFAITSWLHQNEETDEGTSMEESFKGYFGPGSSVRVGMGDELVEVPENAAKAIFTLGWGAARK